LDSIRKRLYFCVVACVLGTAASLLFFTNPYGSGQTKLLQLILFLPAAILAAAIALREGRRLGEARLIVENQLLYIESAAVLTQYPGKSAENVEVFVSCFGLLLGSQIIKFNQEGIRLKTVEIGRYCLFLEYGTDTMTQSVRLIHAGVVNERLDDIIEKFRYETGIVPTVNSESRGRPG